MGQDRAWRGWSLALNASILASAARRTPRRVLAPTYPCDRVCVVFCFFTLVCLRVRERETERLDSCSVHFRYLLKKGNHCPGAPMGFDMCRIHNSPNNMWVSYTANCYPSMQPRNGQE